MQGFRFWYTLVKPILNHFSASENSFPSTWTFYVSVFQASIVITSGSTLVNSVTVSSDSYPAAPNFERPDFDNLHQGLLQPHLYIFKYEKQSARPLSIDKYKTNHFKLYVNPHDPHTLLCWWKLFLLPRVSGRPVNHLV